MSDTSIRISNTPIFDQLVEEYASRGKRYENMVARPVFVNPWPKTTPSWAVTPDLPVRVPGATLHSEEPQMDTYDMQPKAGDQILVRPLQDKDTQHFVITKVAEDGTMTAEKPEIQAVSDSLMFHGITSEEALESASHFPGYVQSIDNPHVFTKKTQTLGNGVSFAKKVSGF